MNNRISIARRLTISISAIVILVAAIALAVNYYLAVENARDRLLKKTDRYRTNLVQSLDIPLMNYDKETVMRIGSAYASDNEVAILQITTNLNERFYYIRKTSQGDLVVKTGRVFHAGELVGYVQIGLTMEYTQAATRRLLWSSIVIILLIVVTLLAATQTILTIFLRKPLSDMSAIANAYAHNRSVSFDQFDIYEEFKDLVVAMKNMGDQIGKQMVDLQTSEEKFRKMADLSPFPFFVIDHEYRITYVNQNFTKTFGYQLEEISDVHNWWRMAYPDRSTRRKMANESASLFYESVTTGNKVVLEERLLTCKNGEQKPVEIFMALIGDILLVYFIDITRRNKMQEMIVQTEKMASVGGLAAGMAHEINNPLSAILQGSQNIIRRLSPGMEKNREAAEKVGLDLETMQSYLAERAIPEHLQGIREAGERASQIILNMLKFSRKNGSRLAPVEIVPILENAIDLASNDYDFSKQFDFKHIRLERDFDPELKKVICTETEIEQVILNLLRNAAQAMKGSELPHPPRIIVRTIDEGEVARIEVEDNGPGMDEETRKRIFEPFYTTKPVGQGTGLGMSVSYTIITNGHHGTIEVESAPGQGARFIIRLPQGREACP